MKPSSKVLPVLITLSLLVASAVFFWPLTQGIPAAHDLADHQAMTLQFADGLAEGTLYPRWLAAQNAGWGEPTMVFYPPALYYVSSVATYAAGGDPIAGLYIAIGVFNAIGCVGLYRLSRQFVTRPWAFVSTFIFMLTPFRAFEAYAGGLLSACAAGSLLPWLFLALYRSRQEPSSGRRRSLSLVGFAAIYAAIALTNLPAALLSAFLTAACVAVECIWRRPLRWALGVAGAGVLGALLASVYLLPAVAELASVHAPHQAEQPDMYASNFIFQGAGSWMGAGLARTFARMAGYPAALLGGAGALLWWLQRRRVITIGAHEAFGIRFLTVAGLTAFLMTTQLSRPLWDHLPLLKRVNLPWRFLDPLAAPVAVIVGCAAFALAHAARTRRLPPWGLGVGASALTLGAILCLKTSAGVALMNGQIARNEASAEAVAFTQMTGYFLPRDAAPPQQLPKTGLVSAEAGTVAVRLESWTPSRRRFSVRTASDAKLFLRSYYYPGWGATLEGPPARRLELSAEPHTGRQQLVVPAGEHTITVAFESTPLRRWAAWLSAAAFTLWCALAIWRLRAPRGTTTPTTTSTEPSEQTTDASAPGGAPPSGKPPGEKTPGERVPELV